MVDQQFLLALLLMLYALFSIQYLVLLVRIPRDVQHREIRISGILSMKGHRCWCRIECKCIDVLFQMFRGIVDLQHFDVGSYPAVSNCGLAIHNWDKFWIAGI